MKETQFLTPEIIFHRFYDPTFNKQTPGSRYEVSSIDADASATVSTVHITVQDDSQVTLTLAEASDNEWPRAVTPVEDYEDSLSLCQLTYCIDFVILVIGAYFCVVQYCGNFLPIKTFSNVC